MKATQPLRLRSYVRELSSHPIRARRGEGRKEERRQMRWHRLSLSRTPKTHASEALHVGQSTATANFAQSSDGFKKEFNLISGGSPTRSALVWGETTVPMGNNVSVDLLAGRDHRTETDMRISVDSVSGSGSLSQGNLASQKVRMAAGQTDQAVVIGGAPKTRELGRRLTRCKIKPPASTASSRTASVVMNWHSSA